MVSLGAPLGGQGRLPAAYLTPGSSSFTEFVGQLRPELLQSRGLTGDVSNLPVPHATTIVSLIFPGGVLMAGDRRATMGNVIANREIEKVFPADEFSCVGIAGAAGVAVEMVRLFQVELEHYEKIEGTVMSLAGKANRLATMIRANLGLALQGLAVVPLFAGYDLARGVGRIFSYDVTGGRYEEHNHHSVGSGSLFARGSLKKLWRPTYSQDDAIRVAVEALYDAADDDSATGGPDVTRRIWPVVATVTERGYHRVTDEELTRVIEGMFDERRGDPGGIEAARRPIDDGPARPVQTRTSENQASSKHLEDGGEQR